MAKPIQVHLTPSGPNPWKVVLILEELAIPYAINSFRFENVKDKAFTDINPNGRVPEEDFDIYDTLQEKHHLNQWLQFQMSGQGPYYGTAGWFNFLHPENIPSAIERYNEQARRVLLVLEIWLQDKTWLVGDRMTYADLAFVPWNERFDMVVATTTDLKFEGFPNVKAWHEKMIERPAWKRAMEKRDQLMDEQGLLPNGMPKTEESYREYVANVNAAQGGK